MLSKLIKDIKLRKSFYKEEFKNKIRKFLFINYFNKKINKYKTLTNKKTNKFKISLKKARYFFIKKYQNRRNSSKVRIVRRCVITSRSRGSIRTFGVSRMLLKDLIKTGYIPGYTKSIW